MKKLQNNYTTPEQSKRLLELGVPAWTADCYYYDMFDKHIKVSYIDADKDYKWNLESEYAPKPCWSVGRLIEIFETCTSTKFERWLYSGVFKPLLEDCIKHIKFALNPNTIMEMDFSKLEE